MKRTTTNRRKLHRRQAVVYYRGSTDGNDGDSIAAQKEAIGRWAAETSHEIVEEVIDRTTGPMPATFVRDAMIQQHVTKQGDVLYVVRMEVGLWRRWRRGEMSLFFHNLSKHPGDRAVFVTTDRDIADGLPFRIYVGSFESCCSHGHRIRKALAWRRLKRIEAEAQERLKAEAAGEGKDETVSGDGPGQ